MTLGTPDHIVDEARGTPDYVVDEGDILTDAEHDARDHSGVPGMDTSQALTIPKASGFYYTFPGTGTSNGFVGNSGELRAFPLDFPAGTLTKIGIEVTGASADVGAVYRLGVYEDTDDRPGALLLDAGTVSAETTGVKEITVSQATEATRYWIAAVVQHAGSQPSNRFFNAGPSLVGTAAAADAAGAALHLGVQKTGVSGALPDPFGAISILRSSVPRVFVSLA